jgi:glucose/mannose-6-phosphate isomerase
MAADLESLARTLDRSNMKAVIEGVPNQIRTALAQSLPRIPAGTFTRAVIVGMGGSALPADVVIAVFGEKLLGPVHIVRHYTLPPMDDRTLVIASSFSGSTEETLSAIEGLPRHSKNVVVVTAGGQLQTLADQREFALIRIPVEREPRGFQPRSAVGYFVTFFARVLAAAGLMPEPSPELASVATFLDEMDVRRDAQDVAEWLKDRIPVVYTDERHLMSIARITKIKFNENSKRPAFFNSLPEANHNEMIGYVKPLAKFGALYLNDASSHPKVRQRFQVMADTFQRDGLEHVAFREWTMPGTTLLERTFAALVFAEWCSYVLALLDGFDPTPVDLVEKFKTALVSSSVVRSS